MIDRRNLIKLSLGAALVKGADGHKFFTNEEFAMVDELTDIIIPTDEKSGGAKAAKVADYIDQRLAEAFESSERDDWRKQLAAVDVKSSQLHQKPFLQCNESQRIAVVSSIEKEPFFGTLKGATVRGYYSSKIGIHDDIGYLGNVYQRADYAGELP